METIKLTRDQARIADAIENSNDNFFVTGRPGCGKSVLTRYIRNNSTKVWYVGAPTGLAALNAEGRTIHSLFGLPVSEGITPPDYNRFTGIDKIVKFCTYQLQHLIIDEISMVRVDTLDFIDRFLRAVKRKDLPFGGVQVVVVGDFFQLPPVAKTPDIKAIKEHWESPFAFSAKVFETFKTFELTQVLRQKGDTGFIDILDRMRTGELSLKDMAAINSQVEPDFEDVRIRLVSTNDEARVVNTRELARIEGEEFTFSAEQSGIWPLKDNFPAETELRLKLGAQVMVKLNKADVPEGIKADSDVVNGDLGLVEKIELRDYDTEHDETSEECVTVLLRKNNRRVKIWRRRWVYKEKVKLGPGQYEEKEIASFSQIPLSLSWAISMHKSQGQSFEAVHIDCTRIFVAGQAYVAFSRCRSLEGITIESRVNKDMFFANRDVLKFNKQLEHA